LTAPDPQVRGIQTSFLLKGAAMMGAAPLVTLLGLREARP
jgi:hypothetical protein